MPVNSTHPSYDTHLPRWQTVRDCVEGSASIKAKKTKYLPKPNPGDSSAENNSRYDAYVERANFVGFTSSTLDGMLGMVFRKPTQIELPQSIEYLKDNSNGGGLSIDQMTRSLVGNTLQTGRFGLLVDYPQAKPGLTKAQTNGLRANILPYRPENIINWQTEVIDSVTVLTRVTLREETPVYSDDGFEFESKEYHRVLYLEEGVYIQRLFDENNNQVGDDIIPRDSTGKLWKVIPFTFVGAQNNDPIIDKAPLYDIAEINIAHYRNSADFEESSFIVGQPTPVVAGLTQSWVDDVMKGGVLLGSRTAWLLPAGASADLLQANPNQMPERGMELKEQQLIKVGARIIQDSSGVETAEAAKIRFGGQNSKLSTLVGNVESGLIQCLKWAMAFMGGIGEPELELNRDFYDKSVDPQLIIARIQMVDRGIIAKSDFQDKLRQEGEIAADRTNEEIDGEAEAVDIL